MPSSSVHDDTGRRSTTPIRGTRDVAAGRSLSSLALLRRRTQRSARTSVVGRILGAATEAVADCGLDGLSMEDVAERAGCSRATVYRRVGGKEALRDAVLDEAIDRINASVALTVVDLEGDERIAGAISASLDTIRADPVSAALLIGPAAGQSVSSGLISQVADSVAVLTGLAADDRIGCELIARMTLSLLCWPVADRGTELAVINRFVHADLSTHRPSPA